MYVVIDCGSLEAPRNGSVAVNTTTVGAIATYTCEGLFTLVGAPTRECLMNASWSGEAPTCEGNLIV